MVFTEFTCIVGAIIGTVVAGVVSVDLGYGLVGVGACCIVGFFVGWFFIGLLWEITFRYLLRRRQKK
jgi:hypothetical protein